jgi:quinol monooxygenase YgiN
MRTQPGRRDEVVAILLRDVEGLREAGCDAYIVSVSDDDEDAIHVMEVWRSAEQHKASLELPAVKAAIGEAMPMLTGEFASRELTVAGGLGLARG